MLVRSFGPGACLLALIGCAVGPDYTPPQTTMPADWIGPGPAATQPALPTTRPVELAAWWTTLDDPTLDSLIKRADEANPLLRQAQFRVLEALALRDIAEADFWPQVNSSSGYAYRGSSRNASPRPTSRGGGIRQRILNRVLQQVRLEAPTFDPATNTFTPPSLSVQDPRGQSQSLSLGPLSDANGGPRRDQNLFQLGVDLSWELDLFGRIRRSVEAAQAELDAAWESERDVKVTLYAEVARSYVELRGSQRRLEIARRNIQVQEETLQVTQDRFDAGFARELEVAQALTQLEGTRSQVPLLETAVRQSIYQLSVLLGRPPGTLLEELAAPRTIPSPSIYIPVGLPSDLLRRRPDIRQAERLVASTTARIGVATADLFPTVALTGSFGTQSTELSNVLNNRSFAWSVGPGFSWPIFQGGRIRANIRAEEAREAQALAGYADTVLVALQEVENALVAYHQERARQEVLARAVDAAQRSTDLSRQLYGEAQGLGNFLDVLESQRTLYAAQDALVLSETAAVTNLVNLYEALGGGWNLESPEPGST